MNDSEVKFDFCPRVFSSKRGKTRHQNTCRQKNHQSNGETAATADDVTNNTPPILIPPREVEPDPPPDAHQTINPPAYKWNDILSYMFEENVRTANEKIVFWRRSSSRFSVKVDLIYTAIMVMPSILLQKPSKTSKAKDHTEALERRLQLWRQGS